MINEGGQLLYHVDFVFYVGYCHNIIWKPYYIKILFITLCFSVAEWNEGNLSDICLSPNLSDHVLCGFKQQENTYLWRTSLYLAASASAEFFADIALAPMEAVKVRIQTQPGYANTLRQCVPKMFAEEGLWA